jgi:hypothetical protein
MWHSDKEQLQQDGFAIQSHVLGEAIVANMELMKQYGKWALAFCFRLLQDSQAWAVRWRWSGTMRR